MEVFVSSKHFFRQLRILALLILGANGKGGYSGGGYSGGALVAMQVTKSYQLCLQVRSHSIIGNPPHRRLKFDQVFASSRFVVFVAVRLQPE